MAHLLGPEGHKLHGVAQSQAAIRGADAMLVAI
jgi:hypothetical protein